MEMVIGKIRLYKCSKCGRTTSEDSEIELKRCPLCLAQTAIHRGCNGRMDEVDLLGRTR